MFVRLFSECFNCSVETFTKLCMEIKESELRNEEFVQVSEDPILTISMSVLFIAVLETLTCDLVTFM